MKALYVGQRVRVIANIKPPESMLWQGVPIGMESMIIRIGADPGDHCPDGFEITLIDWPYIYFHADELEPILPEGLESNEEIDELYSPQTEEVR